MKFLQGTPRTLAILAGVSFSLALTAPTLNTLARDLERVESIREIKDVRKFFSHLAQFGRFGDMAALFSTNGTLKWGNETATGVGAIEKWLETDAGGMDGIQPGSLNTMFAEGPLVSLWDRCNAD